MRGRGEGGYFYRNEDCMLCSDEMKIE